MESLKGKFSELMKYLEESIKPFTNSSYKFIESQRNVFYFSKFSLDTNELYLIFSFIWKIKVNVFKKIVEHTKKIVNDVLVFNQFPPIQEKEKLLTIFSLCYLHYFSIFKYETNNTFDQYYNKNLADLVERYKIIVKDEDQFKAYTSNFFNLMHFEIENLKDTRETIKRFVRYYNPNASYKSPSQEPFKKPQCQPFHKAILTQLVAAKEHIVEMVFEKNMIKKFNSKAIHDDINKIINKLSKVARESYLKEISKSSDPNFNPNIQEQTPLVTDSEIREEPSNNPDVTFYSKRLLSELIRCEVEPKIEKIIKDISSKVDELMLDQLINSRTNCAINLIQHFVCYNVEVNSGQIRTIPEYADLKDDLTLKFLVLAKNIYNQFAEVYFSLYDLVYTDYINLKYILDMQKLPYKFYNSVYFLGTTLTDEMIKQKTNVQENMRQIIGRFVDFFIMDWERTIKENGKKLTHFCLI